MKRVLTLIIALFCSLRVFATEPDTKTFLVLFQSKELKSMKVSVKDIESQFSSFFKTKCYQGNSIPSIFIEISNSDLDECFLGDLLIELEKGEKIKLRDLAFRLVDISNEKKTYKSELLTYENQQKKNLKTEKSDGS